MKNIFLPVICLVFATGCNMNPSKEARIQQLENEMGQALEKINQLETRYQILDSANLQLKVRILELEEQD